MTIVIIIVTIITIVTIVSAIVIIDHFYFGYIILHINQYTNKSSNICTYTL